LGGASPQTLVAHAGIDPALHGGAVSPPVIPSTTFLRDADNRLVAGIDYVRDLSPAYVPIEDTLTRLEGGEEAMLFASGMSAATAVFQTLRPGDHVVIPRVMYWGLRGWIRRFCAHWGIACDVVDASDPTAIEGAVRAGATKVVWVETPANPTWEITDIARAAVAAHSVGAKLVVDSTVATPVFTRPLTLGADIVMHSCTKFLNGHSDVLAGALVTREVDATWAALRDHRRHVGAVMGPFEAWLLLRGMRTLFVRVERSARTAAVLAHRFERHEALERVLYPGLISHIGHDVAKRQMSGGFGGMLSIRVRGGEQRALEVAARLRVFVRATSLGGVESLMEHRASVEGADSTTPKDLLRLSIGLEHEDDLAADLEQALR
jgi:cystathionine gamma-synthase